MKRIDACMGVVRDIREMKSVRFRTRVAEELVFFEAKKRKRRIFLFCKGKNGPALIRKPECTHMSGGSCVLKSGALK